jgi:hypothetical protein
VTIAARALQLDRSRWRWLAEEASPAGAGLIVLGAYLMLAFARFGWPDFALRPTARLMLTGFYGWMGLAVCTWAVARYVSAPPGSLSVFVRLTGHAHLPLLLLAAFIMLVPVTLDVTGAALWPALFAGAFWMPALLMNAVAASSGLNLRAAVWVTAGPYLLWVAVVGRLLWRQLAHLL